MFSFVTDIIEAGGAWGVGLVMFLENIFPPIPSEVVMPLAGYLAAEGRLALWAVLLFGTIGAVAGAWVWYVVGRRLGQERFLAFIDRWGVWLTLDRADAERALVWFARHEGRAVFAGRMVPGVRTLISVPAGLAGMKTLPFLAWTAAGSLLWNVFLVSAGFVLSANYTRVAHWLDPVTNVLLLGLLGIYLWRLARRFLA